MLNHPSQSPSWHGRYPRTLEEAFGTGARLTIEEPRRATRFERIAGVLCCLCAMTIGLLLAWRG
jgi:hypothetical protein